MTINTLFDNILTCGDIMVDKYERKVMYMRIKKLYKDKKYSSYEKEASKYLEKYPNDVIVRFMRARSYRKLNRFDEAIEDLKYNLTLEDNDHSLLELYFIYYYLNRYEEALELLPLLYERRPINAYSVSISELIMKKQLGIDIKVRKGDKCDYIRSQIFNYSTDLALSHLEKHINTTEESISRFNDELNLNILFNLVRQNIKNSKKVNTEEILEIHYFGIANVGYFNNQPCNFIKVVVVPNTNNIISMYPTNDVDYNYVSNIEFDYNELFNKQEGKLKRLSKIDKFNNRYKRV